MIGGKLKTRFRNYQTVHEGYMKPDEVVELHSGWKRSESW